MKKHILILIFSIFIIACNEVDENGQQEEEQIIKVIHHYYLDCFTICDEILSLDNENIAFQQNVPIIDSNGNMIITISIDTTVSINNNIWENSIELININEFFLLDSIYARNYSSFGTEGHYDLTIITNKSEKTVRYLKGSVVEEIDKLHSYLTDLRIGIKK